LQRLNLLVVILSLLLINTSKLNPQAQGEIISPRGYQTSPEELRIIAERAADGEEPYFSAVNDILRWAGRDYNSKIDEIENCPGAESPGWLDNDTGIPKLYSRALAYQLTGESHYAEEAIGILNQIISTVKAFELETPQCQLNLSWGIPEIVASADLISEELSQTDCEGPLSSSIYNDSIGTGNCLWLLQNWLAKIPYYVVSLAAENSQNNWGASATNTLAYIADFLLNRPDIVLYHRMPPQLSSIEFVEISPEEAYQRANTLAIERNNGHRVDFRSSEACDFLSGEQQSEDFPPVKSQITERGIVTDDARRDEFCNIPQYDDSYQNYPQLYLGHNIQQCELMLRRGDSSCYDNIALDDREFSYFDANGVEHITVLIGGRGSIERAINAVIIDAGAEWRHDSALEVALAYYMNHSRFGMVESWIAEIDEFNSCYQDICFGTLTHGLSWEEEAEIGPRTPEFEGN
jgi:hypothetical protein